MRAQKPKRKTILRDEDSEDSANPDATEAAIPDEEPQEAVHGASIPITQVVDGKINADEDSDSEDNIPIKFCVKRRFEEQSVSTSVEIPKSQQAKRLKKVTFDTLVSLGLAEAEASNPDGSANPDASANHGSAISDAPANPDDSAGAANVVTVDESFPSPVEPTRRNVDCSWEEVQRIDQQLQQDRMSESERKRKAERDHHEVKVYKKQKTKRNLAAAMDTQEPGAQSESDIHKAQVAITDAAAQGANPDEAANPDDAANPDKGSIPDDSTAAQVATQEPLTQSVKAGQATQEPPTQRAGESLTEAGSGKLSYFTSFITIMSARMTTSEPSQEEPSTSMTSENLSSILCHLLFLLITVS